MIWHHILIQKKGGNSFMQKKELRCGIERRSGKDRRKT